MKTRSRAPWVDVAVFENQNDSRVLETFLKDRGIAVRDFHDVWLRAFLFLRPPQATWRIQVRQNDFAGVERMLAAAHPPILENALHCPSCGSLHVNYPQMTRRFFLPTILLHLGIIFRVISHECYCSHCHMTWNLPQDVSHKHRAPKPAFPFK